MDWVPVILYNLVYRMILYTEKSEIVSPTIVCWTTQWPWRHAIHDTPMIIYFSKYKTKHLMLGFRVNTYCLVPSEQSVAFDITLTNKLVEIKAIRLQNWRSAFENFMVDTKNQNDIIILSWHSLNVT